MGDRTLMAISCRSCGQPVEETFADLGLSPLANSFVRPEHSDRMEPFYPLHVFVCGRCFLVQLKEFETPENIFSDYAYFSSYSDTWLAHCKAFADEISQQLRLGPNHKVVELASNDGYLLKFFKAKGIPVLGVEPAANVAAAAEKQGIPTVTKFFGAAAARELAAQGHQADLVIGNNVLAHVPDVNDFVGGVSILLKENGIATFEFPHLLRLMEENQFDTIYHEHFSYLSWLSAESIFSRQGLTLFDVKELLTHGGSIRIYARKAGAGEGVSSRAEAMRQLEISRGLNSLTSYKAFQKQIHEAKRNLLSFLIDAKRSGKKIVGYGAPAKGNTLLNYCGIRTDFLEFTVDKSPHKQNLLLPGTRIPIFAPEAIDAARSDFVLILPWNIKDEVIAQMSFVRKWGAKFVVAIPRLEVIP